MGSLHDTIIDTMKQGFLAFLRLIGTISKKHASAYEATLPATLYHQTDPSKLEEERPPMDPNNQTRDMGSHFL